MDPSFAFFHGLHVVDRSVTDKIVGVIHAGISLLVELNGLKSNLGGL